MTTTPPEVTQAMTLANQAHDIAAAIDIDSPAMYQMAGVELQGLTARQKQLEELRFSLTRPLDESKKRIMDLFRVPGERLGEAIKIIRDGMTVYQAEERRKAEEARREAEARQREETQRLAAQQREAQEKARLAQAEADALAAAGDAEAAAVAQQTAQEAAAVAEEKAVEVELAEVAPIALPVVEAPKAAGISTRTNWKAEVIDLHALITAAAAGIASGDTTLAAYLTADTKALGQVAKALKAQARIPGVRIYGEEGLAVRA